MDDLERRIAGGVRAISDRVERLIVLGVRTVLLPITIPLRLLKLSIPPALHIGIFLSLLPLLGLFSISAGVLVSRWLPTGWSEPLYLQYGEGVTPFAYTTLRSLAANQPYDISVHLVVPKAPSNYDLGGNFMTSVTLMTMNNKTVHYSQRPALLPPPSLVSSVLGVGSAFTTLEVPVFSTILPGYSTLRAKVEVGRADGWRSLGKGEGRELAVSQAHLNASVKLRGILALLSLSPTLTSVVTAVVFFGVATLIAAVLYLVLAPSFSTKTEEVAPSSQPRSPGPAPPLELKPALRRRRSSVEIKPEPEAEENSNTLRRRRSILSSRGEPSSSGVAGAS